MFASSVLKRMACCTVLMALAFGTMSQLSAEGSRYYLRIENASSFDIHRLYVSSSDEGNWGPDQLGVRVLRSGDTFTLTNITAGEYDVKLVDEDGDSCTVAKISVYRNTSWRVTDAWLLQCEFH